MRNIIIAGGSLVNKGAQAMTLISVCELKKRFPGHRILLLCWDASPAAREKHAMYDLELLEVPPLKFSGAARDPIKRILYTLRYGKQFQNADNIYRSSDLLIDISGYALGSNWSAKVCNDYLDNIEHALAYRIPVYLMPQSFGPFDFSGEEGKRIDQRLRKLLPQVKRIFAREQEGYDALTSHYGLKENLSLFTDMVLSSKLADYQAALREPVAFALPDVPENSVCLIPSIKIRHVLGDRADAIYHALIRQCLSLGLHVYITHHSTLDHRICSDLKAAFADERRVVLLEHDHSCMEFNELAKKFRFVVSSRFHAIVHALKNGVPCVALGWATKYMDLMKLFGQERYVFDLREKADNAQIQKTVADMAENWEKESALIRAALPQLQKETVFDYIKKA